MKTARYFLLSFALIFLVPYWLGTLVRWFGYGLNQTGQVMACTAFAALVAAWLLGLVIKRREREG